MKINCGEANIDIFPEKGTKSIGLIMVSVLLLSLTGCSNSDYSDLRGYIKSVKAKPAGRIAPVPEFESYKTFEYTATDLRDPFKMFDNAAEITEEMSSTSDLMPDMDRNKETLEQYPLDTLEFVGHLEKGGQQWAIITSPDKLVHRVRVGNHLGMNYGEIIAISETKIMITEIIQDGMGGWIEREAALSMRE
ncbi:MAG: pilus assembly protein PilP [Gammaproteobacteria bacterium]|nr:pilus assembly protein PilP [Gammaproteobacteria bacterium]